MSSLAASDERTIAATAKVIQPAWVRTVHWINAVAMILMIMSGWQIYNASPLFNFKFAGSITLGGWLGGALLWHFAAMWLLMVNGLIYLALGFASGRFRKKRLSIWKPVQLQWLTALFGGYDVARYVHFICMAAICAFLVVHVVLALLVPKSLRAMIIGR